MENQKDYCYPDYPILTRDLIFDQKIGDGDNKKVRILLSEFKSICLDVWKKYKEDEEDDEPEAKKIKRVEKILSKMFNGGSAKIKYDFKNKEKIGRIYPVDDCFDLSFQGLSKIFKNYIIKDFCYDIDIKNCHPNILNQLMIKFGKKNEVLNKYCEDRDQFLAKYNGKYNKYNFLKLFYKEKFSKKDKEFYNEPEINYIHKSIFEFIRSFNKDVRLNEIIKMAENKSFNKEGSILSYYLQTLENDILMYIITFLEEKNIKVHCPMFDGCTIYKDNFDESILKELEEYIFEKTHYKLNIVLKDLDSPFEKIFDDKDLEEFSKNSYEYLKNLIENEGFGVEKVKFFKCTKISREIKPYWLYFDNKFAPVENFCEKNFKDTFRHLKCDVVDDNNKLKQKSFINEYLDDPNIKSFEEVEFDPTRLENDKSKDHIFNSYRGLRMNYLKRKENLSVDEKKRIKEDVKFVFDHILNQLCNKDKNNYNYFLKWLYSLILRPGTRNNITILIKSNNEGVGKDIFAGFLGKIIGDCYFSTIQNPDREITGNFNRNALENKFLVVISEMNKKFVKDNQEEWLTLTAGNYLKLNEKNVKIDRFKNFTHILLFSNKECPIIIDLKDRRYFPIDAENVPLLSNENKNRFLRIYEDEDVLLGFVDMLKELVGEDFDVDKFQWAEERPMNEFRKSLILDNLDEVNLFMLSFLKFIYPNKQKNFSIETKKLFECFCKFNNGDKISLEKFSIRLLKLFPEGVNKGNGVFELKNYNDNVIFLKKLDCDTRRSKLYFDDVFEMIEYFKNKNYILGNEYDELKAIKETLEKDIRNNYKKDADIINEFLNGSD